MMGAMTPYARLAALAVPLIAVGAFGLAGAQTEPQSPAFVTTDSAEYCNQLSEQATQEVEDTTPNADVMALMTEGQRMCARGQVKGGILRLRRVLMILRPATAQP
jgi:hypothetical protein